MSSKQPKIFLSYARQDLETAERLQQALEAHGHTVWRDQESVYGGQNWPKAIGEAIAGHDVVLLLWSEHASHAHFVEFEWSTALALKKTIIPCFFDETSLPPSLRSYNGLPLNNFEKDILPILKSLQKPAEKSNRQHNAEIIEKLSRIAPHKPKEAAQEVRKMIHQEASNVRGPVYQAGGDISITIDKREETGSKHVLPKWQTWVIFLAAALIVISLLIDLPRKMGLVKAPEKQEEAITLKSIGGTIWEKESREPLADVYVYISDLRGENGTILADSSDLRGRFKIENIKTEARSLIRIVAQKTGYQTYRTDASPGNPKLEFYMEKKP